MITHSAKQVLIEARRLIAEVGWTQGTNARDSKGLSVSPHSERAACYCASGAIMAASRGTKTNVHPDARQALLDAIPQEFSISGLNDELTMTKEVIIEMFDRAIGEQI